MQKVRRLVAGWMLLSFLVLLAGCSPGVLDSNREITSDPPEIPFTDSPFALGPLTRGEDGSYEADYGDYPHVEGSVMCRPLAEALARQHLNFDSDDIRRFVNCSGKTYAFEQLIFQTNIGSASLAEGRISMEASPVDLLLTTELNDEDWQLARQKEVPLWCAPVAVDALVFIVHKDNPLESLTLDQVRRIFAGSITNWAEVGGENLDIAPYQGSEATDGESMAALRRLVMKETPLAEPLMEVQRLAGAMEPDQKEPGYYELEYVAPYRNSLESIGFTFRILAKEMADVKELRINEISSETEDLRSGRYPLAVAYYGVIREADKEKTPGNFLDWLLSEDGQILIEQAGYTAPKNWGMR